MEVIGDPIGASATSRELIGAPNNCAVWTPDIGPGAAIPELFISDNPLLGFSRCDAHNLGRNTPANFVIINVKFAC